MLSHPDGVLQTQSSRATFSCHLMKCQKPPYSAEVPQDRLRSEDLFALRSKGRLFSTCPYAGEKSFDFRLVQTPEEGPFRTNQTFLPSPSKKHFHSGTSAPLIKISPHYSAGVSQTLSFPPQVLGIVKALALETGPRLHLRKFRTARSFCSHNVRNQMDTDSSIDSRTTFRRRL